MTEWTYSLITADKSLLEPERQLCTIILTIVAKTTLNKHIN